MEHAFLGQLDVNPVDPPGGIRGGKGAANECEFWAQAAESEENESVLLRIEGRSAASGASSDAQGGDGRLWRHEVKLAWEGIIEMSEGRITRLLAVARGSEKLKWANSFQDLKGQADVSHLPGGHAIDLECAVRYGLVGEPVAAEDAGAPEHADQPPAAAQATDEAQRPGDVQRQLAEVLGGLFLVFRDKVQAELKLSDDQKQKLHQQFGPHVQATMQLFEKIKDLMPAERERALDEHRRKSEERLSADLKGVLDGKQQARLFQLQLQQAGAFALLGQNEAFVKLKITDQQRSEFMQAVQAMQTTIQTLIKELPPGSRPEELHPKVMRVRKEHEGKIEAILTAQQKEQWKELLGKPFEFGD